jgi:hypothetical protein
MLRSYGFAEIGNWPATLMQYITETRLDASHPTINKTAKSGNWSTGAVVSAVLRVSKALAASGV